jgi:hypothetical protein
MASLSKKEIHLIVNDYIGISGGYLGSPDDRFTYRTHEEFYPLYCDLDIDPNQYTGTTCQKFIAILEASPPDVQAKIVRGILQKFPSGNHESGSRRNELREEILAITSRLESAPGYETQHSHAEVFISYAWGGESEVVANKIDAVFQRNGITLVRDKRDIGFKGLIKSFMKRLGIGGAIIIIIDEKYLKSANCMFELLEIAENGKFHERIFPIVLENARIYKPLSRLEYVKHWEKELQDLDEALKTVSAANLHGFREDIDLYAEIRSKISSLTDILKDMNALSQSIHVGSDFQELLETVKSSISPKK